jgi:hypothetical protein
MDVEEVVEHTGAPKLLWYILTNHALTAVDPKRRPERYTEVVWLKVTWIYKRMLDQMDVQEEVLHASVSGTAESVRKVMQAHGHMPWSLVDTASTLVNPGNIDLVMAFIGWIHSVNIKIAQTLMTRSSMTPIMAQWCQAGMIMRRREGIDEIRMLIVGERCFNNLMTLDDHGGWGFEGLADRNNTRKLGAVVHEFIRRYPIMFWHGALFALVSGNAKPSHVNMLFEVMAMPTKRENVGNMGTCTSRGVVPRIQWDPVHCGAGTHGRSQHSYLAGRIFNANDEFLRRCTEALERTPTEPVLP